MNIILGILIQCDTNIYLKLYIGQCPTLHGQVILPCIFRSILAILNFLPISASSG